MLQFLLPIPGKIIPPAALDELAHFEEIHKSPYGDSFYNTSDISWTHKPEGSLRISDHWNFLSRGELHCPIANTDHLIENKWLLAEYKDGAYHVLKEYGPKVDGYLFQIFTEQEILLHLKLLDLNGIEKSPKWYRKHLNRPTLAKETHTKNKKQLIADIEDNRLTPFMQKHHNVKKVVYLDEHNFQLIQKLKPLYERGKELESLPIDSLSQYGAEEVRELPTQSLDEAFFILLHGKWLLRSNT